MYLHVGNNKNIREPDIIGIFDMHNSTVSHITRKYLADAEKENRLISASDEIPKSFVVYKENGIIKVCISQISTSSLLGRTETV